MDNNNTLLSTIKYLYPFLVIFVLLYYYEREKTGNNEAKKVKQLETEAQIAFERQAEKEKDIKIFQFWEDSVKCLSLAELRAIAVFSLYKNDIYDEDELTEYVEELEPIIEAQSEDFEELEEACENFDNRYY